MERSCRMTVWIDGALVLHGSGFGTGSGLGGQIEWLDMMVPPEHIAGMEVYTRPAQLPARFNTPGSACGAIVVWTR